MQKLTGSGMKISLTLPSLANNFLNCLGDENDDYIYTYIDQVMRHFVRQCIKGGRCSALNQCYKSTISDQVFNFMSQDLGIDGNICENLNK